MIAEKFYEEIHPLSDTYKVLMSSLYLFYNTAIKLQNQKQVYMKKLQIIKDEGKMTFCVAVQHVNMGLRI
jgi:hypothetical protein